MEIKLVKPENKTTFADLKPGDVFTISNKTYVKCAQVGGSPRNCVDLLNFSIYYTGDKYAVEKIGHIEVNFDD